MAMLILEKSLAIFSPSRYANLMSAFPQDAIAQDASHTVLYPTRRLKDMAVNERPQERLQKHGASALADSELLAMLLRSGSEGCDVLSVAGGLITEAGSLGGLLGWSAEDFQRRKGIGRVKALQLLTVFEIARRILLTGQGEAPLIDSPAAAAAFLRPNTIGLPVEKFYVLCLNRKNRLIRSTEVTSGTATQSLVHPREVFREAIRTGATGIICAHNHPTGDPQPSRTDRATTRALKDAAQTLGIDLHDHVILGDPTADPTGRGYFSFQEAGLI